MAGAEIVFEFDSGQIDTAVEQLRRLSSDWTPLMRAIGVQLAGNTRSRFPTGMSPAGDPWKALRPDYASVKRGPSTLIGFGMQGGLQGSITFQANGHQVAIGSNLIYAAVHQFGATIVPKTQKALVFRLASGVVFAKSVTIPARPYLGLSEFDRSSIVSTTDYFLGKVVTGQPWPS